MEDNGRNEETQSLPENDEAAGHIPQSEQHAPPAPRQDEPVQAPLVPRKRARSKWLKALCVSLAFAAVAGGCFVGGMEYGESRRPAAETTAVASPDAQDRVSGQQGPGMPEGPMAGEMRGTMGEVVEVGSSSVTVEDARTGETVTYRITGSTEILDGGDEAEIGEVDVGDTVMVVASSDGDGVAERIVIDPGPGMGGPGGQDMAPPSGGRDTAPSG